MRVPDISVSRLHAQLVYKNDTFYLEDLDSKFGTLLLMSRPYTFEASFPHPIRFQVGRTLVKVENTVANKDQSKGNGCW